MIILVARIYFSTISNILWISFNFQPDTVPLRTVNRQCSSGLQAVADVAAYIKAGFYDIGQNELI